MIMAITLKQIEAGDFDKSKHYMLELLMVVMYGQVTLKLKSLNR